jgi:hypothetical protein
VGALFNGSKLAAAAAIYATANGALAWTAHENVLWFARDVVTAPEAPDPANEGRWIFVVGPLTSDVPVDDPDYVLPRKFVVLARAMEQLGRDSDGDPEWRRVERLGPIGPGRFVPPSAQVGGYMFSAGDANFADLPRIFLREDALRTDSARPGVARATFDAERGRFNAGPDVTGGDPGTLTMHGYEVGAKVSALGKQERGRLVPARLRPDEAPRVLVSPTTTLDATVRAEERREPPQLLLALIVASAIGMLLAFMHPFALGSALVSCGLEYFFESEGVKGFFARLGLVVAAIALPVVTGALATAIQSPAPAVAWIVATTSFVVWQRWRRDLDLDLELEAWI